MRCVLLNRNYPPNPGITGYSAAELANYLHEHGVGVHVVTVGGNYEGGVRSEKLAAAAEVHMVKKVYDGKNKLLRLVASLIEGRRMARRAVRLGVRPLITLTDPPLLNYWVAKECRRNGVPWMYWAMDIYPEAFAAAGLAKANGWLYQYFRRELQRSVPDHLIALGDQQAEYLRRSGGKDVPTTILPCGVDRIERAAVRPEWLPGEDKITFCYIGNLGQAHDPGFVEAVIAALDPERHHFILSVYGIHGPRLLRYAERFAHVTVRPTVERGELGFIDIHLASLEPVWDHVCVPSKAVSAVCAGSGLFLCASEEGDNWQLLKEAAWRVSPGEAMVSGVARVVGLVTRDEVDRKRGAAVSCREKLFGMKAAAMASVLDAVRRLQKGTGGGVENSEERVEG